MQKAKQSKARIWPFSNQKKNQNKTLSLKVAIVTICQNLENAKNLKNETDNLTD